MHEAKAPNTPTPAVNKINIDKLNELRAKLIANRQSTPVKDSANTLKNANTVNIKAESTSRPQSPAQLANPAVNGNKNNKSDAHKSQQAKQARPTAASMLSQSNSIDALLAEGQATAQSHVKQQKTASQPNNQQKTASQPNNQQKTASQKQQHQQPARPPVVSAANSALKTAAANMPVSKADQSPASSHKQFNTAEQTNIKDELSSTIRSPDSTNQQNNSNASNTSAAEEPNAASSEAGQKSPANKTIDSAADQSAPLLQHAVTKSPHPLSNGSLHKTSLSLNAKARRDFNEEYFKDVDLWLQITGYHDKPFREQKLKTHKMRAALEEKRRQLEREFAELERQEAAAANDPSNDYMRSNSAAYMPPPAAPASAMNDSDMAQLSKLSSAPVSTPAQPVSAGTKRPRSPSTTVNNDHRDKLSRTNSSGRTGGRRDDLFDKPSPAGPSRRGSDQR